MKILLSGAFNPAFEALPEYLAAALRGLGHEVVLFDHRAFLLPGRLRTRAPALDRWDRARLNRSFIATVRRIRPDQVIVNQGMTLNPDTILAARRFSGRWVNWFADFPAEFDLGLRAAEAYDMFHLGSSWAAARHREAGHARSAWLPFACDPGAHRPPDPGAPGTTGSAEGRVVFVGSHYPERQVLLRHLRGLPVDVWGPRWERAQDDPHVAPMIRGGALRPAAWRVLYGRSAVALNIHYGAFGPASASGDMANTRVFEILGCGALQVVDRQGDAMHLFREGEHLLAFSGGDELRSRVEEALAEPDWARAVAGAGRRAVLAAHTYAHRARALLGETVAVPLAGAGTMGARPAIAGSPR
jgi:spore maturation protein CgeB